MPPFPTGISDDLCDFLNLCFIKDPKARPEAMVMFEHAWVRKLNPEMVRLSTEHVLMDPGLTTKR